MQTPLRSLFNSTRLIQINSMGTTGTTSMSDPCLYRTRQPVSTDGFLGVMIAARMGLVSC